MKNPFKEMVYLGLGAVVVTKHKADELLERLVNQHPTTRDEGERIISDLKVRLNRAKSDMEEQVDSFAHQFAAKTNLAKEEVLASIKQMLEKPKKAKREVRAKTHALTDIIAEKSAMTKDQVNETIGDFLDEVLLIKLKAKKKGKKLSGKIKRMSDQGKTVADGFEAKSAALLDEVKSAMQKAMDKFIDGLHLANSEDLEVLEKRIDKLEQKEISK